jgi:uncharacterized protein (DUF362 family)
MTCYFRHMKGIFEEAGVTVTSENKKAVDAAIQQIVGVEYKHCAEAWKKIKEEIRSNPKRRAEFIAKLREISV